MQDGKSDVTKILIVAYWQVATAASIECHGELSLFFIFIQPFSSKDKLSID